MSLNPSLNHKMTTLEESTLLNEEGLLIYFDTFTLILFYWKDFIRAIIPGLYNPIFPLMQCELKFMIEFTILRSW